MNANSPRLQILFRAMKADKDGRPVLGKDRRTLGVKPGVPPAGDIPVDVDGFVTVGSGGLSVAPDDPRDLPLHRRPKEWGGDGRDPVFALRIDALPQATLALRLDRPQHGLIEPTKRCKFDAFQKDLHSTRSDWAIEKPNSGTTRPHERIP